jgi:hypothetical protein
MGEGRGKREEGRGKMGEGRGKREEGEGRHSFPLVQHCLLRMGSLNICTAMFKKF